MGRVYDEIPGGGAYRRTADGRWEQTDGPAHPGAEDAPEAPEAPPEAPQGGEDARDG